MPLDVVAVGMAKADAARKIARAAKVSLLQAVATRSNNLYSALSAASAAGAYVTYRTAHVATCNITSLSPVFGNCYGTSAGSAGQTDGPSTLTVKCTVEWPASSATGARGFFKGSRTATIEPGGSATTDPIPVNIPKGTQFYIRTAVQVPTGGQWPLGLTTNYAAANGTDNILTGNAASAGSGEGNNLSEGTGDLTVPSTTVPAHNASAYSPYAILGTTSDGLVPTIGVLGDSIINGSSAFDDTGYMWRALANGYGYLRLSQPGETADNWVAPFSNREMRTRLYQYCTHIVCAHGRNDLSNGRSLAQIQTSLIAQWVGVALYGAKLWQATITPKATSVDGFSTLGGQTTTSDNAILALLNPWLRDGAPMSAGVQAAVGTVGASRCAVYDKTGARVTAASGAAHPLVGIFDVAAAWESSPGAGKWTVAGVRTITDFATTSASNLIDSPAVANYPATDVGTGLYVPGAGTAGAALIAQVVKRVSATRVQINKTASATLSGVTGAIGTATTDGLHGLDKPHRDAVPAIRTQDFTV